MLIRWATEEERSRYGFDRSTYQPYDVLIAVDRMTNTCLGILGFSRGNKTIGKVVIDDDERKESIAAALTRCADNQITPAGGSFHYRYPRYARQSLKEHCPSCNHPHLVPEGLENIAELDHSWVVADKEPQGRLWGKCTVSAKYHSVPFYDLPEEETSHYMGDVKRVAKALHQVTGAVKINYEIHCNSGPHLHCHLFPRYLDDGFPSAPIDYRQTKPSAYESAAEYEWFLQQMRSLLAQRAGDDVHAVR